MIDHVSVRVEDFSRLLAFYRDALAPIGYSVVMEYPGAVGLGADGKPDLWLMQTDKAINPTHLALSSTRERIDAFHAAALAAGGTDNGPPGPRLDYHPNYYAAFVHDPEGNNIEVCCHEAPGAAKTARVSAAKKKPAKKLAAKSTKSTKSAKPKAKVKVAAKKVAKPAKPAKPAKAKAKKKKR